MPRLGELLLAADVLGPAQLEEGLRAQVIHGARLGTNLVELGHLELDQVAVALARQHRLPPALRRHFERCNPEIQRLLPSALAARCAVVPIGYIVGDRTKVLVAARDPIPAPDLAEIEAAMGLSAGGVVVSIAAELRILFFLERVYGIPRANRFLRVRRASTNRPEDTFGGDTDRERELTRRDPAADADGATDPGQSTFADTPSQYRAFEDHTGKFRPAPPSPAEPGQDDDELDISFGDDGGTGAGITGPFHRPDAAVTFEPPDDFHIEETPVDHLVDPPAPGTAWRRPRAPSGPATPSSPAEVVPAPVDRPLPLGGEELRRFVETIADPPGAGSALGRIALRRAARAPSGLSGSGEVVETAALGDDASLEEVARAIRRGHTRSRVGELAVGALRRFGDGLDAAIVFVVREDTAIGWKGYSVGVDDLAVDDLAIPLASQTVLSAAVRESRALLIDGDHGSELDRRLWRALDKPQPGQVAVAPVTLAGTTVALLYGQSAPGCGMAPLAELFAAVQQAITAAFGRLLRAAQR